MRSIDQLKIDRIHKATLDIVYAEGFDHISMRHISEMAKVSPAAPYVYYKDKQDLLTSLYYKCLDHVNEGLLDSVNQATSTKEKMYVWISHMVQKFCDVPVMVKYIIKFYRQRDLFIDDAKEHYFEKHPSLDLLCREAIASGQAKTSDSELMEAMLLSPVIRLFDVYEGHEDQFDPKTYEECIRLSVESVLF